jgi:hypothetical protein
MSSASTPGRAEGVAPSSTGPSGSPLAPLAPLTERPSCVSRITPWTTSAPRVSTPCRRSRLGTGIRAELGREPTRLEAHLGIAAEDEGGHLAGVADDQAEGAVGHQPPGLSHGLHAPALIHETGPVGAVRQSGPHATLDAEAVADGDEVHDGGRGQSLPRAEEDESPLVGSRGAEVPRGVRGPVPVASAGPVPAGRGAGGRADGAGRDEEVSDSHGLRCYWVGHQTSTAPPSPLTSAPPAFSGSRVSSSERAMQLYTKILIGLVAGAVLGLVANILELVWLGISSSASSPSAPRSSGSSPWWWSRWWLPAC